MISTKTTLVADLLYGTIALSPLEKRLISTRAFNRLHNVLQNSTVYFTYPSNRTSRFSHSLGVAKLTGDLFRSGLLNAKPNVAKSLLQLSYEKMLLLLESPAFLAERQSLSAEFRPPQQPLAPVRSLDCQFYDSMLVPALSEPHSSVYIVLLQAIRFAALMHDLGHPPFSHVAEFALDSIYKRLTNRKSDGSVKVTDNEVKTLETLLTFLGESEDAAFHEVVGIEMAQALLSSLITELQVEQVSDRQRYAVMLIKHVTLAILNDSSFFAIFHKLVASELDGDRLDYVQRDLVTSGISREPFRPDRLIQSYTLIEHPGSSEERFQFLPSIRSLNNVEDFFTQRFQLYKYVVFHHRVVKFDGLMERCIEALATTYFEGADEGSRITNPPNPDNEDELVLTSGIRGLWQILSRQVMSQPAQRENFYIQWDDAWLLSLLRKEYFRIRRSRENFEPYQNSTPKKSVLEIRLEELLSNRKNYHALFKRAECFIEIDHSFADSVPPDFDWNSLPTLWNVDEASADRVRREGQILQKYISNLRNCIGNQQETTQLVEQHGYLITRITTLFRSVRGKGVRIEFLHKAAERFMETYRHDIKDVIIIPKALNPGLKKFFLLADNNGEPIEIGRISRVADELERGAYLFPPFFAFVLLEKPEIFNENLTKWRKGFGAFLWEAFRDWSIP